MAPRLRDARLRTKCPEIFRFFGKHLHNRSWNSAVDFKTKNCKRTAVSVSSTVNIRNVMPTFSECGQNVSDLILGYWERKRVWRKNLCPMLVTLTNRSQFQKSKGT